MKRTTHFRHLQIANDTLYYIYTHIDAPLDIEEITKQAGVSRYHLQRIFKAIFGKNIYETIKSIRLEKAANLLIVNATSTITQIANACGYSSQSTFIGAFKERFGMTPTQWRKGGYKEFAAKLLEYDVHRFEALDFSIVTLPKQRAYYIRHRGYDESIKEDWMKLRLFAASSGLKNYKEIALYHDNPAIKPLHECAYVACLATKEKAKEQKLPSFYIADGSYAKFSIKGESPLDLELLHYIFHYWIPQKGFETTPKPPFAIYHKNHYLGEPLELSLFVSITF